MTPPFVVLGSSHVRCSLRASSGRRALVLGLALLLGALAAPLGGASDWPQWRGPTRDGRVDGAPWPDRLRDGRLARRWTVELGPSYAGPIVAGDRVFTVETRDEEEEIVRAFDRTTGETLWRTAWEGAMDVPFFAARNGSWVRSTPAFDDGALYVAGMRDVLVRLDAETGEEDWRVDFPARDGTPLPTFGFVSSPLVVGDHVLVQAGAALVKLDKATGETVWRSLDDGGGMMGSAFSSPILASPGGVSQFVVQTRTHLAGVAPEDGGVLWRREIPSFRGMNILTPTVIGDAVFTATYGGRSRRLDLAPSDAGVTVRQAWEGRTQGNMTSPVVVDGHAYLLTRGNRFTCIDLTDGEVRWTSGPTGDDYWSLVRQGDRILALANTGILRLVAASPDAYDVLDEVRVSEADTWAHLAVVDGALFVRDRFGLSAFDWR
ncbi:MAG: PQQ-binding-like beta-propeller repeat protein [Planctomycetota bacterium JB042]